MKLWSKLSIIFGICLFASSCEPNSSSSDLESVPQDGKMKVFKVPLPVNFFSFGENKFPDEVPLITSTKGRTAEQYGYWVLCSDPAEQKAVLEALGLDSSKYVTAKSSLTSAGQYQPNPAKRDEEKKKYCSSPVLLDKVLCSLYNLAPEQQSPIICPSSLGLIDGGYDLSIYGTGTKFYAEFQNGLAALTAMDLGCLEVKDALTPKSPTFAITPVEESQAPIGATDLNCARGTPQESFISICTDARTGKAKDEFFTLNALSSRLGIPSETECDDLKTKINDKISALKDEPLDLSKAGLTSLKLLRYLPAVANVKTLLLNDNENLGASDTAANGVLDELKSFINLTKINIQGTQIGNMLGLKDLQFLTAGLDINWTRIFPSSCSTASIAESLRKSCETLQKPITLLRDNGQGSGTVVVGKISDTELKFTAKHPFSGLLSSEGFQYLAQSTCGDVIQEGSTFKLKVVPVLNCELNISVKGGRLIPSNLKIAFQPLDLCDGHAVDSTWSTRMETFTLNFSCERFGDTVRTVTSGVCHSNDFWFDAMSKTCVLKTCDNGVSVGKDWSVTTFDGHGTYKNICIVHEKDPIAEFIPGSGTCSDSSYDFDVTKRECVLKRCASGLAIGSEQLTPTQDGKGSYLLQCSTVQNQARDKVKEGSGICLSPLNDFIYGTLTCEVARCENGAKIGSVNPSQTTRDGRGTYVEECARTIDGKTSLLVSKGSCFSSQDVFDPKTVSCTRVCLQKPELPAFYFQDVTIRPTSSKPGNFQGSVNIKNYDGNPQTITVGPNDILRVFTDIITYTSGFSTSYYYKDVATYNRGQLEGKVTTEYYNVTEAEYSRSSSDTKHRQEFRSIYAEITCETKLYLAKSRYYYDQGSGVESLQVKPEEVDYLNKISLIKVIDCQALGFPEISKDRNLQRMCLR